MSEKPCKIQVVRVTIAEKPCVKCGNTWYYTQYEKKSKRILIRCRTCTMLKGCTPDKKTIVDSFYDAVYRGEIKHEIHKIEANYTGTLREQYLSIIEKYSMNVDRDRTNIMYNDGDDLYTFPCGQGEITLRFVNEPSLSSSSCTSPPSNPPNEQNGNHECGACGHIGTPKEIKTTNVHKYKCVCGHCGRHVKWGKWLK